MIDTDNGIVLHVTKYKENQLICSVLTLKNGVLNLAYTQKNGIGRRLLQPSYSIEFSYSASSHLLASFKQIQIHQPFHTLSTHPIKNIIVLFVLEIMHKCWKDGSPNATVYYWFLRFLTILDNESNNKLIANGLLTFLVQFLDLMGIFPDLKSYTPTTIYFSILEGIFVSTYTEAVLTADESLLLKNCLQDTQNNWCIHPYTNNERGMLIHYLLVFYKVHLEHLKEIKSYDILRELL